MLSVFLELFQKNEEETTLPDSGFVSSTVIMPHFTYVVYLLNSCCEISGLTTLVF